MPRVLHKISKRLVSSRCETLRAIDTDGLLRQCDSLRFEGCISRIGLQLFALSKLLLCFLCEMRVHTLKSAAWAAFRLVPAMTSETKKSDD